MKIDIESEKHNPFMKRKEIIVSIDNPEEATPSKAKIAEFVVKHSGKEIDHVEIVKIASGRGMANAKATVFVWDEKPVVRVKKKEEKKAEAK